MKLYSLLFILIMLLSCNKSKTQLVIDNKYISKFEAYKVERATNRINYLQLTGLFKLEPLENTFGKDTLNDFIINIKDLPKTIGTISVFKDSLVFRSSDKIKIRNSRDSIITYYRLDLNEYGSSIKLFYNNLNWQVITRSEQYYLRVWHKKNPAIEAFKGFQLFRLNSELIFKGHFSYFDKLKNESVYSQLGVNTSTNFIGKVTFEHNGITHDLDVGKSGFTMVSDQTTGDETYGGGRYIYLDLPESDGSVSLDFNYLYNPPCTFSEFTTCLYPPKQNDLPFKILAGEKINFKNSENKIH